MKYPKEVTLQAVEMCTLGGSIFGLGKEKYDYESVSCYMKRSGLSFMKHPYAYVEKVFQYMEALTMPKN